jgi:hypothetical protein
MSNTGSDFDLDDKDDDVEFVWKEELKYSLQRYINDPIFIGATASDLATWLDDEYDLNLEDEDYEEEDEDTDIDDIAEE